MKVGFQYIDDFINNIDVECPNCSKKALVKSNPTNRKDTKFVCVCCGKNTLWRGDSSSYEFWIQSKTSNGILIGQPVDCYFKLQLWYSTVFKGEILFAYNQDHLCFLKDYIDDKLRARTKINGEWRNSSLQSRLPKWMLKSENRAGIIKKINELKDE